MQKQMNVDNFGKIEPFILFRHNNKQFKTTVKEYDGAALSYNETFYLSNVQENQTIDFELYDKDPISQELLGKAEPILI
jgi:Ca2+-dependent lipid-binding protein